jgi:hypothetical protein
VSGSRIEQRVLLRDDLPLAQTTLVVRGGRDSVDKLRRHAERTARAWALDGQPLLGVSVFAVLGMSLNDLLRRRSPVSVLSTCQLPDSLVNADSSCWPPVSARTARSG